MQTNLILGRGENYDEEIQFEVRFYCFGCHERVRECNYLYRIYSLETAFTCRLCNKRFSSGFEFRKCNLMLDTGHEYVCSYCDKNFESDLLLFDHCVELHSGKKPYECEICDKQFPTKVELTRHRKTHFRPDRVHTCDVCDEKFSFAVDLKSHSRIHGLPQRFECKICNLRFKNKFNLAHHMKKHEATQQKYSCDVCRQAFPEEAELESHSAIHAKKPEEEKKKPKEVIRKKRTTFFPCDVCSLKLSSKDCLINHRRKKHGIHKMKTPVKDVLSAIDVTTSNNSNAEDEESLDDPEATSVEVTTIPTAEDVHVSDIVDVVTLNPQVSFDVPNSSRMHVSTIRDTLVPNVVTLNPRVFNVPNASRVQVSTFPPTADSDVQDVIDVFEITEIPNHVNVCDVAVIPNYVDMRDVCVIHDVNEMPGVIQYCGPTEAFIPTALVASTQEA